VWVKELNASERESIVGITYRIVPATGRVQHQVSCELADNLFKFIPNQIKMSSTFLSGMGLAVATRKSVKNINSTD
jgi:hypothetical protein